MHAARPRALACLALTAMLLLAVTPTIGRLVGGAMPHETGIGRVALSSMPSDGMEGMTAEEHMAHMAHMQSQPGPDQGRRPQGGHAGHDCAYCPLLAGLVGSTLAAWQPQVPAATASEAVGGVTCRATEAPVPALGSQGPPIIELS